MSDLMKLEGLSAEALGEVIRARADEFDKSAMRAVEHAWHAGRALLAAKKLVPHGQWGQWLKDNFGERSQQTASNWMRLASNYQSIGNLETVKHGLLMLEDSPEKQQKRAEREARKAEAPPKSLAPATPAPPASPGVIRHKDPPAPQTRPEKPAWLADPDELDRPEETDPPPLPRTNTHHTPDNRRTPDARETDRIGIVPPDDPRTYHDGHWYQWCEDLGRMVAVTNEQILQAAALLRVAETVVVAPAAPPDESKPGKFPTLSQLRKAIDAQAGWGEALRQAANDWAAYKMSLSGKEKIRSMDSWKKALVRMGNVAKSQSVSVVCEAIEKAIANGWTGWEHLDKVKGSPAQLRSQAAGTEDFGVSYEVLE